MSSVAIFPVFIVLAIAMIVPFIVGFYVYQDARRRGMNALLWTLVAVAAPALIGLIVYLLIRGNYSDLRCPKCDTLVKEQFVVCPKCGTKLRLSCPNCAMPVEPDWKVCPKCTQPLADVRMDVQIPVRAKDKFIWKVLAIVLIIPVLLITILVLSLSASFSAGSSGFAVTTIDEYPSEINSKAIANDVQQWLSSLDPDAGCAYALRYDYLNKDNTQYFYLVYVPGADSYIEMAQSSSIFGTTITLGCQNTGNKGNLFHVVSSADKAPNLKIKLDGKKLSCEVTSVDYNPTLYYIVPNYGELGPGAVDFFMPERISVVKLINNHNEGVVAIDDKDVALNILVGIDSAPYLDMEHDIYRKQDGTGGYDFKDGFEIIIEYEVHDDLVFHEDMLHCLAMEYNGGYYIMDDRPDNGRFIREIDEAFYNELSSLFE
jgi:uncharacterized Zn-finger protein